MSFVTMEFYGESIQKMCSLYVLTPDLEGPLPVLYLLHGLSDNHSVWFRRTALERYVQDLPLIVVMPDAHRSFYVNDKRPGGLNYEAHIAGDVVGIVDRTFHTVRDPAGRGVAGLSMGGYGAVMLALRHPEVFSLACSHSGAMQFAHSPSHIRPDVDEYAELFDAGEYDVFHLARRAKRKGRLPALYLDCGTEDPLLAINRQYHAHLEKLQIDHEYTEYGGAHDWDYWDLHIRQSLAFAMARLGRQA